MIHFHKLRTFCTKLQTLVNFYQTLVTDARNNFFTFLQTLPWELTRFGDGYVTITHPEVSRGRKERADGGRDGPRGEHGKKGAGRQGT